MTSNNPKRIILLIFSMLILAACNGSAPAITPQESGTQESATPETITSPTSTPDLNPTIDPSIPLAAIVNGQVITLDEYQAEIARAKSGSETGLVTYSEKHVLQTLIDEVLLAQGAAESGYTQDEALLNSRLDQLDLEEQTLQDWITANGYSQESFKPVFARSVAAAWMRDQIISQVSSTAEQVHAQQILQYNSADAENAYAQLQSGTDFATLAAQYDPLTSGDLGWFPRGFLTVPQLDDPVFSLQPGEFTDIIETNLGFHIVQVIELDPQHPLSPGAFQTVKVQAVANWLVERRSQSDIQILLSE